jgi:hypothetical protein
VFEWYKRFSEGREDVEDDKLSGRPVTVKTDENVEKARSVMRTDRHLGIRMTEEEVNFGKETMRQILSTNMNMKELCSKMDPKNPPVFIPKTNPNTQNTLRTDYILLLVAFLFSKNWKFAQRNN